MSYHSTLHYWPFLFTAQSWILGTSQRYYLIGQTIPKIIVIGVIIPNRCFSKLRYPILPLLSAKSNHLFFWVSQFRKPRKPRKNRFGKKIKCPKSKPPITRLVAISPFNPCQIQGFFMQPPTSCVYIYIYYKLYIHIYTLWIPLIQTWLERSRFIRWFFRQNQPDLLGDSPASHLADSRRVRGTNSCSLATLQFVDVCCLPAKPFLKWAIDMVLSQNKSGENPKIQWFIMVSENHVPWSYVINSGHSIFQISRHTFVDPDVSGFPRSPVPWVRRHCSPPAARWFRLSDIFSLAFSVPSSKVSRKKMAVMTLMTWTLRWVSGTKPVPKIEVVH